MWADFKQSTLIRGYQRKLCPLNIKLFTPFPAGAREGGWITPLTLRSAVVFFWSFSVFVQESSADSGRSAPLIPHAVAGRSRMRENLENHQNVVLKQIKILSRPKTHDVNNSSETIGLFPMN